MHPIHGLRCWGKHAIREANLSAGQSPAGQARSMCDDLVVGVSAALPPTNFADTIGGRDHGSLTGCRRLEAVVLRGAKGVAASRA